MKWFKHGILGMNARNLRYIREHNSPDSITLADSKLKTKNFLWSRGIPFAETYAIIWTYDELQRFDLRWLKHDRFVIKPNKGSGGRGILIIKRSWEWYQIWDEVWTEKELRLHMLDIIHGSYSLHSGTDSIVIEELILPGGDFAHFCRYGLADIRVIVYNLVPISAMVRMPSDSSWWKANLAQWGIGIGLNIANGEVISLYKDRESYFHTFPEEYAWLKRIILPFWESILLYSSQIQLFTGLGYLALDWVITKNGPKLLEINARAGLEIQNVNLTPLEARLRKIEDLRIMTPEKWVEIAKSLFHTDPISPTPEKEVLHFVQKWRINEKEGEIQCDLMSQISRISPALVPPIGEKIHIHTSTGVEIYLSEFHPDATLPDNTVILGKNILDHYLIDTTPEKNINTSHVWSTWQKDILDLDRDVFLTSRRINLSSVLKPDNYSEELHRFINASGQYNPQFLYHFPHEEKHSDILSSIDTLQNKAYSLKKSGLLIADLYIEKLEEMQNKLEFLKACWLWDFPEKYKYNELLFWKTHEDLFQLAREKSLQIPLWNEDKAIILGKILDITEIISQIHLYFESHKMRKVPIIIENGNLSRISVSYGKEVRIKVSKNAIIHQKELEAILSHEIWTHLRRYFAGQKTGLKIFEQGTGYYLSHEEGLAVYKSYQKLPEWYEKNSMYLKYFLVHATDTLDFIETIRLLQWLTPEKSLESLFSDAVRLKRWTSDTSIRWMPGSNYHKDKIYLDGYMEVNKWIQAGWSVDQLFIGKIKIHDLNILQHIEF
jgi:alpha-L-glutamate ligase-like protein